MIKTEYLFVSQSLFSGTSHLRLISEGEICLVEMVTLRADLPSRKLGISILCSVGMACVQNNFVPKEYWLMPGDNFYCNY